MRDMAREFRRECRRAVAWKVIQVAVALAAMAFAAAQLGACGPTPAYAGASPAGIEVCDG